MFLGRREFIIFGRREFCPLVDESSAVDESSVSLFDTVDLCNFVINELNPTSEVQNMGNGAFQNGSF